MPPLDLHRDNLIVKYWYRLQRQPKNPPSIIATDFRFDTLYNIPILLRPFGLRARGIVGNLSLPYSLVAIVQLRAIAPGSFQTQKSAVTSFSVKLLL